MIHALGSILRHENRVALSRPTIGQTVSRTDTRKTTEAETIPLRPYRCDVNGPGIIAAGPEREKKKVG